MAANFCFGMLFGQPCGDATAGFANQVNGNMVEGTPTYIDPQTQDYSRNPNTFWIAGFIAVALIALIVAMLAIFKKKSNT